MSLQIIVQQINVFGQSFKNLSNNKTQNQKKHLKNVQQIQLQRFFRCTLGNKTYTSTNTGFFMSQNELIFDEPFTLYFDSQTTQHHIMYIQIFVPHFEKFNNTDLANTLFAQFDLSDISTVVLGDTLQTTVYDIEDKAVGKMTVSIEVFRKGARFIEKVTSSILFETVKYEKQKLIKASQASKNIKQLMVNNSLTNTIMTISYLEMKPLNKEDQQIFNRQSFILIRYGFSIKVYTKLTKVLSKQSVVFVDNFEFMKNEDVKFQFFFMYIDDLGNMVCRAKGQIRHVVFDQTINNHTIVMFDKRSQIYGDLMVKFGLKQVDTSSQTVNLLTNKIDKRIINDQANISIAIDEFNRFKFESKNNNRILSQKLRELELRKMQEQEQKSKPIDEEEKKKREEHAKFIEFLQKEVIKIQRELKKKQVEEKHMERKGKYVSAVRQQKGDNGNGNFTKTNGNNNTSSKSYFNKVKRENESEQIEAIGVQVGQESDLM